MPFANNKKNPNPKNDQEITLKEYLDAKQELEILQKEYGIESEKKEGVLSRFISWSLDKRENRKKIKINRKKYLWITVLGGWFGLHRFFAKQYWIGMFYLVLCWTGFPLAMTLIDLLIIIPLPVDTNGNIEVL